MEVQSLVFSKGLIYNFKFLFLASHDHIMFLLQYFSFPELNILTVRLEILTCQPHEERLGTLVLNQELFIRQCTGQQETSTW